MDKKTRFRSKNIDDSIILSIVEILDGWVSHKLTWELLIQKVDFILRKRYTRQALSNHSRISDAFAHRKIALKSQNPNNKSSTISPDHERIARLENELARLKMENNQLLEQFHRWIYNGNLMGNSDQMRAQMNNPLPLVYRDASKT